MQFWFEFASPYTYIAAERIGSLAASLNVEIEWKPFLLGAVLHELGGRPPTEARPWQLPYIYRDVERLCAKYALPVRRPSQIQRSGLLASRVTLALAGHPGMNDFVRAVFRANFVHDRDIGRRETIADILAVLDLPVDATLRQAASPAIKQQLREQVEEARRLGIFGSPSFVVGDELFWGQDRLEDAVHWTVKTA